jgi:hypothetical protein
MVIDGAAILIRGVVIFAQKFGELSQNRDTTHFLDLFLPRGEFGFCREAFTFIVRHRS